MARFMLCKFYLNVLKKRILVLGKHVFQFYMCV